jgi:hypothetical protein
MASMNLRNWKIGPLEGGSVENDVENSSDVPHELEFSLQEPGTE